MPRVIYREGPTIYISIIFTNAVLIILALILGSVIFFNCTAVNSAALKDIASLSRAEVTGLLTLDELGDVSGASEARAVITDYELAQEKALQKELKAQKKRVAAAKKKKEEEEARRKIEEAKRAIEEEAARNTAATYSGTYNGAVLSPGNGTIMGPSGKETYYNLNMSVCVSVMRRMGFSEEEYPYNVRDDGCKCLGDYVMVAANLKIRPKGTFILTSRGVGIVVDTGGFAKRNPTQLDLATNW